VKTTLESWCITTPICTRSLRSPSVGATGAGPHVANRHVSDSLPFAEWSWANSARRLAGPARPPLRPVPPILRSSSSRPTRAQTNSASARPAVPFASHFPDAIGGAAGSNCGAPTRSASAGPAGGLGRGLPSWPVAFRGGLAGNLDTCFAGGAALYQSHRARSYDRR